MDVTVFKKKIVIADDHFSVREGLVQMVDEDEELIVCAAVDNGVQLLRAVSNHQPDLVITDIRMPELDGLEAGIIIKREFSAIGLLAYVADENDYLLLRLLDAGFDGIVLKRASKKETITGIHSVLNGRGYFCNTSDEKIKQLISKKRYNPRRKTIRQQFSDRELAVLQLLCKGKTSKEIAETMQLSERTIEGHRENMLRKTNSINVAGLVCYAFVSGLFKDL